MVEFFAAPYRLSKISRQRVAYIYGRLRSKIDWVIARLGEGQAVRLWQGERRNVFTSALASCGKYEISRHDKGGDDVTGTSSYV